MEEKKNLFLVNARKWINTKTGPRFDLGLDPMTARWSNGEVVPTPVPPPCRKRISDDSSPEKREESELKDRGGVSSGGHSDAQH